LGPEVKIRAPRGSDEAAFLAAVRASQSLHKPWVQPPSSTAAFHRYLARVDDPSHAAFLILKTGTDGGLVGVINISEIVLGPFQSAYLGYYAFEPFAGRGLMRMGFELVLTTAFRKLKLHRLEANIQPANHASRRLVRRLGFTREGLSPRYLKIAGRWRDHERWALLADEW
jgi:ribosomal-protein-alanine N-acetyltransferase